MQYSRRVRKFQTKKGFTLTKFLQEKHTSLRGTISDVTQINVNLQKKKKNNGKSNEEYYIFRWINPTNDTNIDTQSSYVFVLTRNAGTSCPIKQTQEFWFHYCGEVFCLYSLSLRFELD